MHPERFIVGCADPAKPLPAHYREVLDAFGCPILSMRYESAELAKISINFCLVASISVANTLAEVSEAIGADWEEIVPALEARQAHRPVQLSRAPALGLPAAISSAIFARCSTSPRRKSSIPECTWTPGS